MTALPAREYLDEAAKMAGLSGWAIVEQFGGVLTSGIVAHARALEAKATLEARLAKYEVDQITAEIRECIAQFYEQEDEPGRADDIRRGASIASAMAGVLRIRIAREKEHPL